MKIISIVFKNPFEEAGYTETIKINDFDDINVFIGKNNSGKTNILHSIFNLLHQGADRSGIFRRIKVILNHKDISSIFEKFYNKVLLIYQMRDILKPEIIRREHRLKSNLKDGKFVNFFNSIFNQWQKKENPFPNTFSMVLNFNCNTSNKEILLNHEFINIIDLDLELKHNIEEILKEISNDPDLTSLLIDEVLPLRSVVFIPSFRTLGPSNKDYEKQEITKIDEIIETLFEKSFNRIPIDASSYKPFEIPNLALILNTIERGMVHSGYRALISPDFFNRFVYSLKQIFHNIEISIKWDFGKLKTVEGYIEDDIKMGDWTKLGHGTQELISFLFLTLPCLYINQNKCSPEMVFILLMNQKMDCILDYNQN